MMLKHVGIFAVFVGLFTLAIGCIRVDEPPLAPAGMVLIPAGSFEMGSDDDDAYPDEQPVHTVHLDAFYMDMYEVTNAQFKVFVDANPHWQKDQVDAAVHGSAHGTYLAHWYGNDYLMGKPTIRWLM